MDVFRIDSVDIDSIECIRDPCLVPTVSTCIVNMVWLKSPESHTIFTIHVDTVDTRQGSLMHSMLPMSTLSIQFSHLTFTLYKVLCKCRHC